MVPPEGAPSGSPGGFGWREERPLQEMYGTNRIEFTSFLPLFISPLRMIARFHGTMGVTLVMDGGYHVLGDHGSGRCLRGHRAFVSLDTRDVWRGHTTCQSSEKSEAPIPSHLWLRRINLEVTWGESLVRTTKGHLPFSAVAPAW